MHCAATPTPIYKGNKTCVIKIYVDFIEYRVFDQIFTRFNAICGYTRVSSSLRSFHLKVYISFPNTEEGTQHGLTGRAGAFRD